MVYVLLLPVRPAVNKDGTVYALFYSWKSYSNQNGNIHVTTDVVIVRDDHWGMSANPYTALTDSGDGKSGQRIVTNVSNFIEGPITNQGQDTLNGDLAIAVDPANSSTVYVCWGDYQNKDYTLHLRRSLDRGKTWSQDLLTVVDAKNPGLAINDSGQLCFLYQQLQGAINNQTWETHLGFYAGGSWKDVLL
jgi:hypothetical protein